MSIFLLKVLTDILQVDSGGVRTEHRDLRKVYRHKDIAMQVSKIELSKLRDYVYEHPKHKVADCSLEVRHLDIRHVLDMKHIIPCLFQEQEEWKVVDISFDEVPKSNSSNTNYWIASVAFKPCGVPYPFRYAFHTCDITLT